MQYIKMDNYIIITDLIKNAFNNNLWNSLMSIGTLASAFFAFKALKQTSEQLKIEQTPYVVLKGRITTADPDKRIHIAQLKNLGKGPAFNVRLTTDPRGKISIIDGSNPHSIDLSSSEVNNGWALDEGQAIKGLNVQGINIKKSIINEIPDENAITIESDKQKADFSIFIWYKDQVGNRYKTEAIVRHSGHFLKIMENVFAKI